MLSYYGRYVLLLLAAGAALLGAWRMAEAPVWSMPRGRQIVGDSGSGTAWPRY
jgi:hypothetical protein